MTPLNWSESGFASTGSWNAVRCSAPVSEVAYDRPTPTLPRGSCMGSSCPFTCMAKYGASPPITSAARLRALGQQVADALAARDQLDAADHGLRVAEAQVEAARVFRPDQPVLEAFHRERDDRAASRSRPS